MLRGNPLTTKSFIEQQNKFRGLISEYKSREFVKDRKTLPSSRFRNRLSNLLLDTRVVLHKSQFDDFFSWINHQTEVQVADMALVPIGYDELRGVYTKAPIVSLELELLWITARIKANAAKFNDFRLKADEIESLVFTGKFSDAIEILRHIELHFGVSLWSVQLRIALENQVGGLEQQKRYTAEVRSIYKNGLLSFVAYHTSVRNEDRTTLSKYCEDIKARLDRHQYFEPFVKTYARYRLAGEWPFSHSGLADLLRVEQSHSAVDIYETFVAVAQEISRSEDFYKTRKVLGKCLDELTSVTDFRLVKVALSLGKKDFPMKLRSRSTEISDELFLGNAKLAAQTARRTLKSPVYIDIWSFIYAGLAFAHSTRPRKIELFRPNDISRLLGRILCRCDNSDESFGFLEKLAINLRGLPTAAGLIDLLPILCRLSPDAPWQPWIISMNSPTIGVEDFAQSSAHSIFPIQSENHSLNPTEVAWKAFHDFEYASTRINQAALMLFTAIALLRNRHFQQVVDIFEAQKTSFEFEPLRSIVTSILLHAYFCLDDRQKVITLIADEGSRNNSNRRLLPVYSALENYTWADYKAVLVPLAAPIALHFLWRISENNEIASRLRFATGAVFKNFKDVRPSELTDRADEFKKNQLIYFLKNVCVPYVLDGSRILKSSRDVMEERMAICAALRNIDPLNSDEYLNEVIWISNQLALDEGQRIIDRTRIYVDTESLSRWATRELSEDFARYRDLLGVDVGTIQNFDDVLKELVTATPSQRSNFMPENEADAVLVSMLHRLRDEFLNNPKFGFDFFLSKRVRHQSFIGLIRSPLEFAHFITTRESESGGYHRNEYWLNKFSCSNPDTKEALNEGFTKFSTNFDDTLISAKDRSFHVRSQEKPNGLLYLEFSPQIINLVRSIVQMDAELQDFIDTAIVVLWAALEPSLANVRHFIYDDLKTKIAHSFDEFRANVSKLVKSCPASLEFDAEIGKCSTDVQRALDDVAKWFSHADLEAHKHYFKLDQVVNIAIVSALKCQRAFEPKIEHHVDGDIEMQASSLVFVHDVLFVALDNVRNHSGIKTPTVSVNVQADVENGTLTIKVQSDSKVQNRVEQDLKLRKIRQMIDSGNYGRHTKREGGSGFLKLAAVVRQSSKGQIDFGYTNDGQFQLTVIYSMIIQPLDAPRDQHE